MGLSGFDTVTLSNDAYKAWLYQKQNGFTDKTFGAWSVESSSRLNTLAAATANSDNKLFSILGSDASETTFSPSSCVKLTKGDSYLFFDPNEANAYIIDFSNVTDSNPDAIEVKSFVYSNTTGVFSQDVDNLNNDLINYLDENNIKFYQKNSNSTATLTSEYIINNLLSEDLKNQYNSSNGAYCPEDSISGLDPNNVVQLSFNQFSQLIKESKNIEYYNQKFATSDSTQKANLSQINSTLRVFKNALTIGADALSDQDKTFLLSTIRSSSLEQIAFIEEINPGILQALASLCDGFSTYTSIDKDGNDTTSHSLSFASVMDEIKQKISNEFTLSEMPSCIKSLNSFADSLGTGIISSNQANSLVSEFLKDCGLEYNENTNEWTENSSGGANYEKALRSLLNIASSYSNESLIEILSQDGMDQAFFILRQNLHQPLKNSSGETQFFQVAGDDGQNLNIELSANNVLNIIYSSLSSFVNSIDSNNSALIIKANNVLNDIDFALNRMTTTEEANKSWNNFREWTAKGALVVNFLKIAEDIGYYYTRDNYARAWAQLSESEKNLVRVYAANDPQQYQVLQDLEKYCQGTNYQASTFIKDGKTYAKRTNTTTGEYSLSYAVDDKNTIIQYYDKDGNFLQAVKETKTLDKNGKVKNTTAVQVNQKGQTVKGTTEITFDSTDKMKINSITKDGTTVTFEYDENNTITKSTFSKTDAKTGKTTETTYDGFVNDQAKATGQLKQTKTIETRKLGGNQTQTTETVMDAKGNTTKITVTDLTDDKPTKTTTTEYDPSNPSKITKITTTEYDPSNPSKITKITETEYDPSNPSKITKTTTVTEFDASGNKTVQIYEGDTTSGKLTETRIETIDSDGNKTITIYEGDSKTGTLISETKFDANGNKTQNITNLTDGTINYKLVEELNPDGSVKSIQLKYADGNEVTGLTSDLKLTTSDDVEYTFDKDGKLKTKTQKISGSGAGGSETTIIENYEDGKLKTKTQKISGSGAGSIETTITENYKDGKLTNKEFQQGSNTITETYENGRLKEITATDKLTFTAYDGTEVTYENKGGKWQKSETNGTQKTVTEVDGNKTTVTVKDADDKLQSKTVTEVDSSGKTTTTVTEVDPKTGNPTKKTVTEVDGNKTTVTVKDGAGNLQSKTETVTDSTGKTTTTVETPDATGGKTVKIYDGDATGTPKETRIETLDPDGKKTIKIYDGDTSGKLKETRIETQFDVDGGKGKGTRIEIYDGDATKGKIKNTIIETPDGSNGTRRLTLDAKGNIVSDDIVQNTSDIVGKRKITNSKKLGEGAEAALDASKNIEDISDISSLTKKSTKKLSTYDSLIDVAADSANPGKFKKAASKTFKTVTAGAGYAMGALGAIGDFATGFTFATTMVDLFNEKNGVDENSNSSWKKVAWGFFGGAVMILGGVLVNIFFPGVGELIWSGVGIALDAATVYTNNYLNKIDEQKKTLI